VASTPEELSRRRRHLEETLAGLRADPGRELSEAEAEGLRESYLELVDLLGDDPAEMTALRALGRQIADLEAADRLPQTFVRRTRPRPR
jgi:hypothetical protein